jgi:hypothetical protein
MMPLSEREVVSSNIINSRDHGAIVIVVAAFGMTCFLLFLLIRLAMRWPLGSLSGIDDVVVVFATVHIHRPAFAEPLTDVRSALP